MVTVYMHTVIANNKKYIGQTINNPKERWGSNGHRYRGQLFYNAIKKYGWDNMTHEILADNLTQEEADELERYYIEKYHTDDSDYGYNISPGGRDGAGSPGGKNHNARVVVCIETNQEWECATYCAHDLNVNLASLQESLYHGYKCKGYHYKYKDDDAYVINEGPHKIIQLETGKIWENAHECAKDLGVTPRTIWRYCSGKRNPPKGCTIQYYVA